MGMCPVFFTRRYYFCQSLPIWDHFHPISINLTRLINSGIVSEVRLLDDHYKKGNEGIPPFPSQAHYFKASPLNSEAIMRCIIQKIGSSQVTTSLWFTNMIDDIQLRNKGHLWLLRTSRCRGNHKLLISKPGEANMQPILDPELTVVSF